MVRKTELNSDLSHVSSFKIMSYFIYTVVVCLIQHSLILDKRWSTYVHTTLNRTLYGMPTALWL